MIRQALLASVLLAALAGPAAANCAETYYDMAPLEPHLVAGLPKLKATPHGAYIDRYAKGAIIVTPAFDRLSGEDKRALLPKIEQGLYGLLPTALTEAQNSAGAVALPVEIHTPDGRKLHQTTPCFGDFTTLTEHQRYIAMFSFGYSDERDYRPQTHPLPKRVDMKRVRKAFHGAMSWKPAFYIGWVPETGFFEINLVGPRDLAALERFWPKAPKGFRYDVRTNEGLLLTTVRR